MPAFHPTQRTQREVLAYFLTQATQRNNSQSKRSTNQSIRIIGLIKVQIKIKKNVKNVEKFKKARKRLIKRCRDLP